MKVSELLFNANYYRREKRMEELTKEETIRKHREEWAILADNPRLSKGDALQKMNYEYRYRPFHDCFCCEFARDEMIRKEGPYADSSAELRCKYCPLIWPNKTCTNLLGGVKYIYDKWVGSDSVNERSRLAGIIRDLPEATEPNNRIRRVTTEETEEDFRILVQVSDDLHPLYIISRIMKDGSGMKLLGCVGSGIQTDSFGRIKIIST
jgi:hypothetical protein